MPKAKRFKKEKKLYHLNFEDGELEGFECYATAATLERFVEFSALAEEMKTPEGRTRVNIERQYTTFAEHLQSWNLDDEDDRPVPCTYEGLKTLEFDFVMAIMMAWMQAIATVSRPLDTTSPSGEISREESILQLASLSESRAS